MTKHDISINHYETAQDALKLITNNRIRYLPVCNDNNTFFGLL